MIETLAQAVAQRPEVAGIVLLAGSMAAVVMRRRRSRGSTTPTPAFDRAARAQLAGIYILGAVLLVREVGKVVILLWR